MQDKSGVVLTWCSGGIKVSNFYIQAFRFNEGGGKRGKVEQLVA